MSELRSFLGVYNHSRQFIENYAYTGKPLTKLLKTDVPPGWGGQQEYAMQTLKNKLCTTPYLAYPGYTKEFHVEVGLSEFCICGGL